MAREPQAGVRADTVNTDMAGQKTDTTKRTFNALSKLAGSDSESEMDTQPTRPARTNLVARLKPQAMDDSSDSSEDEDDGDAYERVKKMLMSAPEEKPSQTESAQPTRRVSASSSEDEEDMPVRRQRISRREPTKSPQLSSPTITRSRIPSPGLFVTPDASPVKKATRPLLASDDEESPAKEGYNKDLVERVRRIRAERLALQKKERQEELRKKKAAPRDDGSDSSDGENGRRLTQSTRPARKAGKKALEDMAREQQRISRNMQLTHQAKTKKKYSTKDLLRRFAPAQASADGDIAQRMPTPDASSALPSSDVEHRDTPPSSPPTPTQETGSVEPSRLDKGKGRADEHQPSPQLKAVPQSTRGDVDMVELSDSDDELQKSRSTARFPVFDKIPQAKGQQASSYVLLRHLAHLTSPGKTGAKGRKEMNMTELQASLAQKAREQALKERQEKIEDMRRRGIHVETEEEREKHQLEVEDLVAQFEKAREEDRKLAKRERDEAKKNGEKIDELPSSDESDDDDYVGSGEEGAADQEDAEGSENEAEIELSGSEEEDFAEVDEEDQDEMAASNGLIDDAADESQDETERPGQDNDAEASGAEDETPLPHIRSQAGRRLRHVVLDDDDDESEGETKAETGSARATQLPSQTQEMDAMAAFGFNNAAGGLGLTQAFASSMAPLNSKSHQAHALDNEPEQDSMDFFKSLPDTQAGASFADPVDMVVPNSQQPAYQQDEAQASLGMGSLMQTVNFEPTQQSEMFDPTQDTGFQLPRSPAGLNLPPSTVDTVMMAVAESPMPKKKGRLHRGRRVVPELSDIDDDADVSDAEAEEPDGTAVSEDAFAILAKAAKRQKKLAKKFNKKTSWAKEAVQEQAEESEDEYAGLGGASDEDSEEDEELAEMIDTNEVKVNERELAAFYADKSKKDDEKNINQLYKDIMNGGLRRRRGGDAFDVSDPEDEIEQRRRRKRQQFQQMTRALIADEKIGKIAQNPKQSAFFQTLADHMDDPEYDFLNDSAMDVVMEASNSPSEEGKEGENSGEISVPDSQVEPLAAPANPLKRASPDSQEKENRPPAKQRRTVMPDNMFRKPMTLADVQHSVSELLEDPRVMVPDSQYSDSDSELEIEPATVTVQKQVVDRLSITRAATVSETTAEAHLAFHAPAVGAHQPGFRIPSLVRRATSNLSTVSTSTSGTTTPIDGPSVRRGGTGRSNIHAQAREAERRAALEKVEHKRKETLKRKVGKAQGKRSILRCLDGGFE